MARDTLLLVEKCSHCFSWYDIASGERLRSVQLPNFPHEFVTDRAERYAYVGHYGVETSGHVGEGGHSLLQIDIRSSELVRSIDLSPFNRIHGLQMDQQDRLYALSEEKSTLLVLEQPATDTAARRAVPSGGIKSHLFALTQDGQTAFCMNLLSHTVTKVKPWDPLFAPVACHPGQKPEGYCLSADETTLFVSNRWSNTLSAIDTDTMAVRYSAASREDVTRIYRSADGRLFTSNYGDRSISVVDPQTLKETAYLKLDGRAIALTFHPFQPLAFISLDSDRVAVLDINSLKILRFIATQKEPDVSKVVVL
ncbi:YncE family protein [Rhodoferax saidenbachensis]|uniref:DNA-binding beta-propeller fold protein YncE n=1 Tax=Rhodoferax saidenbachensis TaxID=1484693 RepID=A0ABU1ZSE0_9BURK|nr:YncE family protein [Rhodoferax saidenbachensis]MDR7308466.1 DNA-binding beta-propeller fold protein YncE [Rhodoferax saidenbachensis]